MTSPITSRMISPAPEARPARRPHECEAALGAVLLLAALWAMAPAACALAGDAAAASAELSNQAFALLNSLNAPDADGNTNSDAKAMLGPVASFAGDAQTLSQALSAGDTTSARRTTASLDSDAASVDAALKTHHGALKADRWDALKNQLAAIEKSVPPAAAPVAPPLAPPAASSGDASSGTSAPGGTAPGAAEIPPPSAASVAGTGAESAPASGAADIGGPTIKIESCRLVGNVTQVQGYLEGSALSSAGIYEGEQMVKPIDVGRVLGHQKVEFSLKLRDADIATNLRVVDQAGRMATASVYGEDSSAMASSGRESGVVVDRGTGATAGTNTAEIPSANAPSTGLDTGGGLDESAPSADEGLGSAGPGGGIVGGPLGGGLGAGGLGVGVGAPMGNIQINIEAVNPVNSLSRSYQVVGQIVGKGVRRAGIYVDGRLATRIPIGHGNVNNFSTNFMMSGGTATIRAFGAGNQYVESSITMPPAVASAPPIVVAPYGASPYNPLGMSPYGMAPYGGVYGSPYGMPYGTPFGASPSYGINIGPNGITTVPVSPYGAVPYGAVPYGAAPYAVNPHAPPINPYGNTTHPMGPDGR